MKVQVTSVEMVKGFIHPQSMYSFDSNRYSSSRYMSLSYVPKALKVKGIDLSNGMGVLFYTPTVILSKRSGMLNFTSCQDNSWIEVKEEPTVAHRGHEMFDGDSVPNVALETKCEVVPKILVGSEIEISYRLVGSTMKYVKLLKGGN